MYDLKDLPGIFLFSNIHSPILKKTKNVSLKNSGHLNTKEININTKKTTNEAFLFSFMKNIMSKTGSRASFY